MPATTTGFSDYLSTKWQKVLVSKGGKERPLLYPRAMRVQDMDVNPYLAVKLSGMGVMQAKAEGQQFPSDAPITGGNFSVTANPFGQLFSVTYEMWRDDRYGVMDQMWFDMRKSCRYRQEVQALRVTTTPSRWRLATTRRTCARLRTLTSTVRFRAIALHRTWC